MDKRVSSPFTIKAIGSQGLLYGSLTMIGGYLYILDEAGVIVETTQSDNLTVEKYTGVISYKYMKNEKIEVKKALDKEMKNRVIMTMIIWGVCLVLFAVMFMQFRTIEETDITEIENMREAELRTAISEWKSKYEETAKQLEANQKSIDEYQQKIEQNGEASELVDKDLEKESNMILGKTDVYGEGVIITLSSTNERDVKYRDLLELINELRYAGAEAISINDVRILGSTYVAQPDGVLMLIKRTKNNISICNKKL